MPDETAPIADQDDRIVLITRNGCHLCDDAREVLDGVTRELGLGYTERLIESDPDYARFTDEIPVVLLDGKVHQYWLVDADKLRAALTGTP